MNFGAVTLPNRMYLLIIYENKTSLWALELKETNKKTLQRDTIRAQLSLQYVSS